MQRLATKHRGQVEPPQSTSLSPWFCTLSAQLGTAQTWSSQTPLTQSLATPQTRPLSQGPQTGPPQSVSDSCPLRMTSEQGGTWHLPPRQALLPQSASLVQVCSPPIGAQ